MAEMLERLKQTHFGIIPAEAYEQMQPGTGSQAGTVGIDVRVIRGRVLATSVEKASTAGAKGIRPGWELLAVDGQELGEVLRRVAKFFEKSTLEALAARAAVVHRLRGPPGSVVSLRLRNGQNQTVDLLVARTGQRGVRAQFGFFPPMYVWSEWRKIGGSAGYLAFSMFMDPENVMKTAAEAITACLACQGFIIDLRGNPGGIGAMAMGLAGWFVEEKGLRLGAMQTRETALRFVVNPRPVTYRGPLAILVDGSSASTAEIFSGGMKDLKRARIFGSRTAGAALPSVIEKLPNGDGFQFAIANYISEGGQPLEGIGVIPDEEVELTRETLLEGRDTVLEAALNWIKQQK
jgi:carboxyl-terminal processing protease